MVSPALPAATDLPSLPEVPAAGAGVRAWELSATIALPGALLVAVLISTQFLFQPFVWRHWPIDEVLLGWFDVIRERATTALAIAVALVAAGRVPLHRPRARTALMFAAIARALQWTVVGCSIASMVYLWRRSVDARAAVQGAELRRSQVEGQLAQVRLQVLRSRIEPHFLFNTLATVRRLHLTDPALGAQLLEHLLSYLRRTLATESAQQTSLGQELDLVAAYLNVVATRMAGRLSLRWDVPDELRDCELPPLTIATLVENAVKHGIAPRPEGGTIEVRAQAVGAMLEVTVADTGVGFTGSGGSGIGLANIRSRLATLYGASGSLTLESNRPSGLRARMCLPRRPVGAAL